MTEEIATFLLSSIGRALLREADTLAEARTDMLTALTRLRRTATPEQGSAVWEMAELRRRGRVKFGPEAARMYYVREALEQASGAGAAAYHARRLAVTGAATVTDLGGGIGGDALAFARAGLRVTLIERDPIRALFAEQNARVHGLVARIVVVRADVTDAALDTDAVWLDPARRCDRRRVSDPEEYSPPLSWLDALRARGLGSLGVKLAPAIDHALAARFDAELEFLSESGECREALLWLGAACSGDGLRATVLTADGPHSLAGTADAPSRAETARSGGYLYEPDPAVIRAHLVGTLAEHLGAGVMDPQIAYLRGDRLAATPFATGYKILDHFSYSRRRLQEALNAHDVGRVIVKKRGFPQEPDEVRRHLKLRGTHEMIVILARIGDGHAVFLCRPASESA